MKSPLILAIDTSCDETAAAVSSGRRILANAISSQINIHKKYGGVVPHLAKRAHQQKISFVVKEAVKRANLNNKKGSTSRLDALAVTIGPGLAPALEIGISFAKNLSLKLNKPLIAVNHMEGHLLSSLALNSQGKNPQLKNRQKTIFPAIGLLVSGGHTQLILVKKPGHYQLLGETLDDAAGEALDKLAKMLKLGYPGGPIVEQLAKSGNPDTIPLPIPMQHSKNLDFSFSGLKTAALYLIQKQNKLTPVFTHNLCAGFQKAIAISLTTKLTKAVQAHQPKSILLGGGVITNLYIRRQIRRSIRPFQIPGLLPFSKRLFTDNAAMICIPAYYQFRKKAFVNNIAKLDRQPNLNF